MNCKICTNKSHKVFTCKILTKYIVGYYMCKTCSFIQTEEPFWLDEAYSPGAISALDVGIMSRNLLLISKTEKILNSLFSDLTNFSAVDYGGGQGIFVRMMRDKGFNFYRQDLHAENLYARYFDIKDLPLNHKFNFLTAFEVFEHLPDPMDEIIKMFKYSDIIFLSTELQPSKEISQLKDWWYLIPETGQHVSFYNVTSLKKAAEILNLYFYTDYKQLHILAKKSLPSDPFLEEESPKIKKSLKDKLLNKTFNSLKREHKQKNILKIPQSLTMTDFEYVKKKLKDL